MSDRHARFRRAAPDRRRRPVDGFRATSAARFDRLVADAVASLPPDLLAHLDGVLVSVEDVPFDARPTTGDEVPLGSYRTGPRIGAGASAAPDLLTLFRRPLEARARDRIELTELIRLTVVHEIADHLGIDDERLDDLGWT